MRTLWIQGVAKNNKGDFTGAIDGLKKCPAIAIQYCK